MSRWWPRAPRRSRRCCAAVRWWWPTASSALTASLVRALRLVRLPYFSLPNLLAGEALVPEFFQEAVDPENLCAALERTARRCAARAVPACSDFEAIHATLRHRWRGAGARRLSCSVLGAERARQRGRVSLQVLMAGVDEAGRGPLAGPVVAAAVILDPRRVIRGLRDSKQLTPERRAVLAQRIRERALGVAVAVGRSR